MSEPPPSKDMERVEDVTQIEYSEKRSDVEDQNDDVEEQDKVNTLEKLDCSSENFLKG